MNDMNLDAAIVEKQLAFVNMRELVIKAYNHTYISSVDGSVTTDIDLNDIKNQMKKESERFKTASRTINRLKEKDQESYAVDLAKAFEQIINGRVNSFREGE